jgi:hypothetical protein
MKPMKEDLVQSLQDRASLLLRAADRISLLEMELKKEKEISRRMELLAVQFALAIHYGEDEFSGIEWDCLLEDAREIAEAKKKKDDSDEKSDS